MFLHKQCITKVTANQLLHQLFLFIQISRVYGALTPLGWCAHSWIIEAAFIVTIGVMQCRLAQLAKLGCDKQNCSLNSSFVEIKLVLVLLKSKVAYKGQNCWYLMRSSLHYNVNETWQHFVTADKVLFLVLLLLPTFHHHNVRSWVINMVF